MSDTDSPNDNPIEIQRRDVAFSSQGVTCRAWHFMADTDEERAPCVVLGHGLGATRACALEGYGTAFARAGLHALAFDYRHFGASDGRPRQLIDLDHQLEDWAAALEAARRLEGVDPARVAAWGSSLGGGHALVAGVRDGRVAAIVAQCPMLDGREAFLAAVKQGGVVNLALTTVHALRDAAGALLGQEPHCLPLYANPGELGFLTSPDAAPGYSAIAPDDFVNAAAARLALTFSFYRPLTAAGGLRCPLLLLVCDHDVVTPPGPALRLAENPLVEVERFPMGHFEIYQQERAKELTVAFLRRALQGAAG
jgi:pimeloyl-ACP methyl ester carboxylesterase